MQRIVTCEILDSLSPEDAAAKASRSDLRLLNKLMGNAAIIRKQLPPGPFTIAELGAGDGTFAQDLLNGMRVREVTLIDLQPSAAPREETNVVQADVFDWVKEAEPVDVIYANLFLHHFSEEALRQLFAQIKCSVFIACEPRRNLFATAAAMLVWLIGCNYVTRHDAVVSVKAGFRGRELTNLWPATGWEVTEQAAFPFSHLFVARKCQK